MNEDQVLAESTYDETKKEWTHKCGESLLAVTVTHSVHEMPQALAGSGQTQTRPVPYCPSCHEKPSTFGSPINPGMAEWPKHTIKEK